MGVEIAHRPIPVPGLPSTVLILFLAILTAGCAQIRHRVQDDSYLTPIPRATLDAYQYGRPVETRLQAVIVAQRGILSSRADLVNQPAVIFAEKMDYKEAIRRTEQPGATSYMDPTALDTPVWLVVFEGEWTITAPLGTVTPPFSSCAFAVFSADDSDGVRAGTTPCENLDLTR